MTRIHNESVWTTVVIIQIEDDITDELWQSIVKECVTYLHDMDRVFSPYRSDSYLNLLASDPDSLNIQDGPVQHDIFRHYQSFFGSTFTKSAVGAFETIESLCAAAQWKSNGAFNAWRNDSYDPIGLVKGWAADYVIEILKSYGITQAFVNAGGDIACMTLSEPWRIAIGNPSDNTTALGFLEISNGALCTSGIYEKGNHIQTRNNQSDFSSVTISGPSAALADAYATAVIADGLVAFKWLGALGADWGAIAISGDLSAIYTHNWQLNDHQFSQI